MIKMVTITSQGQLTIPMSIRRHFGIRGSVKAHMRLDGERIIVEPKADFWALAGSLVSSKKLTDAQLTKARASFQKQWARND